MKSKLTSRERVLAALAHEQTDRVPRDFWAEPPTWNRLLEHFGFAEKEQLLEEFGIDVRHLDAPASPDKNIGNGVFQNFWGERFIYNSTPWGPMREDIKGALAEATNFCRVGSISPGLSRTASTVPSLAEQCRRHGERALLYGFADVWQRPALVRGWEEFFVDMVEQPEWVHFLSRKFTDFYLEDYTRAAEATGGRIDLYLLISDLGSQKGPLLSLPMFRTFVAPYLKEMIDCIHALGGKVLFHSCGMIRPFIPELISLGVDVLDPIQPAGPEMAPEKLKADFGARLSFHGGIDMQKLLPGGTPEQVRAEAERYCEVLGKGGGYILAPAHLFQPDVPPENVAAVYGVRA